MASDAKPASGENSSCAACGMSVKPRAYHPYAACLMFRACREYYKFACNVIESMRRIAAAAMEGK